MDAEQITYYNGTHLVNNEPFSKFGRIISDWTKINDLSSTDVDLADGVSAIES